MDQDTFNQLADLALTGSGQLIPSTKTYLVEARLASIARREGFGTLADLMGCVKARPNPVFEAEIIAALASHNTQFFPHRTALEHVVAQRMPVHSVKEGRRKFRIWFAGGASGQEAYSLAMLLAEARGEDKSLPQTDIISTDICELMTTRARAGLYGHFEVQRGLSIHRLLAHFKRQENGHWQISKSLRAQISFRTHNLLEDMSGLGQFDIILCRNVLSDMAKSVQGDVAERLAQQLVDGGRLIMAPDESLAAVTEALQPDPDMRGAYVSAIRPGAHAAA